MIDILNTMTQIVISLFAIACCLGLLGIAINFLSNSWKQRKDNRLADNMWSELTTADQWLRADFPIVEDLVKYFKNQMRTYLPDGKHIPWKHIDDFRDELRKKYKEN